MRVILTEEQFKHYLLIEYVNQSISGETEYNPSADGNSEHNPYSKQIKVNGKLLTNFLHSYGKVMTNIDNGKDYYVYEINTFINLVGKRFCICQLIRNNKGYGAIFVKPFSIFRLKVK